MAINIETQKKNLETEHQMLITELSGLGVMNPENNIWEATPEGAGGNVADENDAADRFEDFEERSSTLSILVERLKDVTDALKKINQGTYGICEISGEPIEEERLLANPAARTSLKNINNS